MKVAFIYTLAHPISGEIRYVGKTDDPVARAKSHLKKGGNTAKAKWVRSLVAAGLEPKLEILDEVPQADWMLWEQHWIRVLRGWGFRLLNGDNGGLGHQRITPELASKIASSLRGRSNVALARPVSCFDMQGNFVRSYDSFAIAASNVRGSHSNIVRAAKKVVSAYGFLWRKGTSTERLSAPNYVSGRYLASAEHREHLRASGIGKQVGKVVSSETRRKQSDAAKARHRSTRIEIA